MGRLIVSDRWLIQEASQNWRTKTGLKKYEKNFYDSIADGIGHVYSVRAGVNVSDFHVLEEVDSQLLRQVSSLTMKVVRRVVCRWYHVRFLVLRKRRV